MRIVVVSAHFPPELHLWRHARAPTTGPRLRATAGHEVSVYAGWLDSTREPPPADDVGRDRRRRVCPCAGSRLMPWIGWTDVANFDNPVVDRRLRGVARRANSPTSCTSTRSRRSASGVIEAAAAAGIPVVVTMHDFWWSCARQFLVDRDIARAASSSTPGVCVRSRPPRGWVCATRACSERLASVDLVLCPSAIGGRGDGGQRRRRRSARGRRERNARRCRRSRPRTTVDDEVRFRYTGGAERDEGRARAGRRGRSAGSRAGADRLARDRPRPPRLPASRGDGVAAPGVRESVPGFAPSDADEVWPRSTWSSCRRSCASRTRCSRARRWPRGVPVDLHGQLGPEEAVVDGVNGLVVPSADADALADAMQRSSPIPRCCGDATDCHGAVPSCDALDDQVDGLCSSIPWSAWSRQHRPSDLSSAAVLFLVGIDGAPLRYRARLPAEALGLVGVHSDVRHYRDVGCRRRRRR